MRCGPGCFRIWSNCQRCGSGCSCYCYCKEDYYYDVDRSHRWPNLMLHIKQFKKFKNITLIPYDWPLIMEHLRDFKKVRIPDVRPYLEETHLWEDIVRDIRYDVIFKRLKVELIQILYHPDRYERMVASYGEVWADIHLPC